MEAMMQATDADMMAVPLCSSVDIYSAEMMIAHHKVLLMHPCHVKLPAKLYHWLIMSL